jgi:predicted DNA-binding protein YlxM (UPF0122 family)/energy-coupling factor transporter ATP-binding protein EcfA2
MRIFWIKGNENIPFNKTYAWLVIGVRGAGKSAFLEHLAELHLSEGNTVLDLFGAKSGENLAWLRSEWIKEKRILLLHGENAIIESDLDIDFKKVSDISLKDFEDYDIIINSSPLYQSLDDEFNAVNIIIEKLWKRIKWHKIIFVLCREAANLMYSRLKVAENQTLAKAFLTYWLRESRHVGCSLGVDSQRFMALDVDVRNVVDMLVFKTLGSMGLPHELRWVYRYVKPNWIQKMEQKQFLILTRKGDLGIGVFPLPSFHMKEGEGILSKIGLKITFEEKPMEAISRGTFKTIGDLEHSKIIEMYIDQNLGMHEIAKQLDRSSRSILLHIDRHNEAIEKMGYCPACRRSKSKFESIKAEKIKEYENEF